jgi:hypothetical protein
VRTNKVRAKLNYRSYFLGLLSAVVIAGVLGATFLLGRASNDAENGKPVEQAQALVETPTPEPTQEPAPPPPNLDPPTPPVLPDRMSCPEIRSSGDYRSDGEREWFLSNCRQIAPAPPPTPIAQGLSPIDVIRAESCYSGIAWIYFASAQWGFCVPPSESIRAVAEYGQPTYSFTCPAGQEQRATLTPDLRETTDLRCGPILPTRYLGNYDPPADFCLYAGCISNFWNGRGYVVQCNDGMFSKSGGIQGACSGHAGVWR